MTAFQRMVLRGLALILQRLIMIARVTPGGESFHNAERDWFYDAKNMGVLLDEDSDGPA